jgi:glucuronate isomerase
MDAAYLATLVADHRLDEDEAISIATDLAGPLVRRAYKLESVASDSGGRASS